MKQQRGVALITALVLLLVTTLIGITSATTSIFNERLASNRRENLTAYYSAQYAIENAEAWLKQQDTLGSLPNPMTMPVDNASDVAGSIWVWVDMTADEIRQKLVVGNTNRDWQAYSPDASPVDYPFANTNAEQPKVMIQYSNHSGGISLGQGNVNQQSLDVFLVRAKGLSGGADGHQAERYYESVYVQPHNVQ